MARGDGAELGLSQCRGAREVGSKGNWKPPVVFFAWRRSFRRLSVGIEWVGR